MEIIKRALRFLKRPSAERNQILMRRLLTAYLVPFHFGRANLPNVYLAYHPDSQVDFRDHPEFAPLFKSFVRFNKINNAGDGARLWSFILNLKQVIADGVDGDFAELGVWRGNTAAVLAHFAAKSDRKVYLFDTFEGFDKRDMGGIDAEKMMAFKDTSIDMVRQVIGAGNAAACHFVKGYFPDSVEEQHRQKKYAAVSLDCDLYEPTKAGLQFFYPLMPKGGLFLLHDYSSLHWDGSKKAIDEFCAAHGEHLVLMPDKSGSAFFRKSR